MASVRLFVVIALVTLFFCDVNAPPKQTKEKAVVVPPQSKAKNAKSAPVATPSKTARAKSALPSTSSKTEKEKPEHIKKVENLLLLDRTVSLVSWDKGIVELFLKGICDPIPQNSAYNLSKMVKKTIKNQMKISKITDEGCLQALDILDVPWDNNFIFSKIKKLTGIEQLKNFKIAIANIVEEHLHRIQWLSGMMERKKIAYKTLIDDLAELRQTFSFIDSKDKIMPLVERTNISLYSPLGQLHGPSTEEKKRRKDFVVALKSAVLDLISEQFSARYDRSAKTLDYLIITEAFLVQTINLKEELENGKTKKQDFRGVFNIWFVNLVNRQIANIKYDIENIFPK